MKELRLKEEQANASAWRLGSECCFRLYQVDDLTFEDAIMEMRNEWRQMVSDSDDPLMRLEEIDNVIGELDFVFNETVRAQQREQDFQEHLRQTNEQTLAARRRPSVFTEAAASPAPRPAQLTEAEVAIAKGRATAIKPAAPPKGGRAAK
jgi:hypothetical protein